MPATKTNIASAIPPIISACGRLAWQGPGAWSTPTRYAIAIVFTAAGLLLRFLIAPQKDGMPYVTFFPAATLAALTGGIGPGIAATIGGAILADYYFIPPLNTFTLGPEELISAAVFCVDELIVCVVLEAVRRYYAGYSNALETLAQTRAEEAKARAVAERANDAKSAFLAAASHDLRQPFQAMRLYYEVLDARDLGERENIAVDMLGNALGAGEELLSALLDIAKLEAGTVQPLSEPIRLGEVLDEVAAEFSGKAIQNGIRLTVKTIEATVCTDRVLLKRILRNLVENAVRHTWRGGIIIRCRPSKNGLAIQVWDTGEGIPYDQLHMIFDDFYQLNNPARDRSRGLGLGLAIVRRTAQLLGFQVSVASRVGRGSVFSVLIPLAAPGVSLS